MLLTIHTDGSCFPNPGGTMGIGWHADLESGGVSSPFAHHGAEVKDSTWPATCNTAEFLAFLHAAQWCVCLKGLKSIRFITDSTILRNAMMLKGKVKAVHLAAIRHQALAVLKSRPDIYWSIEWVSRDENTVADGLAAV